MSACAELEGLLAERASGPIAPEDEARVAEHLAACAGCARVYEEYRRVFGLVSIADGPLTPALSPLSRGEGVREGRGESIARSTLRAFRQRRQRRVTAIALAAGFGAAAAAAALVLAPAFVARAPRPAAVVASSWEPDVDAALSASGTSDDVAAPADDGDGTDDEVTAADVALAAYDDATSG
ncbi:MAG TPA: zf-HC2 domain-containing protein [Anaeromyxobacteraceae bacterium]|nr:zf-HC2 domain-containing protein [Anaeromyxobacteraceae bacterium]